MEFTRKKKQGDYTSSVYHLEKKKWLVIDNIKSPVFNEHCYFCREGGEFIFK